MRNDLLSQALRDPSTITCEARALFRNLIEIMAEFDRTAGEADRFAVRSAFEMQNWMNNKFSMLAVFDRFRYYELEFPDRHRQKLSRRLDLRDARTYGEAAQIALEAVISAGLPRVLVLMSAAHTQRAGLLRGSGAAASQLQ